MSTDRYILLWLTFNQGPTMLAVEPGPTSDAVNELLQNQAVRKMIGFADRKHCLRFV